MVTLSRAREKALENARLVEGGGAPRSKRRRYEKKAKNYLAMLQIATILLWMALVIKSKLVI